VMLHGTFRPTYVIYKVEVDFNRFTCDNDIYIPMVARVASPTSVGSGLASNSAAPVDHFHA
jgi:hypothetical protein